MKTNKFISLVLAVLASIVLLAGIADAYSWEVAGYSATVIILVISLIILGSK